MSQIKVEYMDHMGTDLMVANVARVSFAKESKEFTYRKDKPKGSDEGIIEYLANDNHWSPFAHAQIQFRIKAPVPIRTQCFKSKQGFVENEESRRYISTEPEVFIPEEFRLAPAGNKKQGSGGVHPYSEYWREVYKNHTSKAVDLYLRMIAAEIAPEQARFVLPQGCMVNWIWTGSLAAYARFCNLRQDSHAQKEVSEVADQISKVLGELFPVAWKALTTK